MARFVTANPKGGLAATVGATVLYVPVVGPTAGEAVLYFKFGTADADWCLLANAGTSGAEPVTADPRSSGLARAIGATCLYVTGGTGTPLYKYGPVSTEWCEWDPVAKYVAAAIAAGGGGGGGGIDDALALGALL